jgi:hypothetical protein
MVHSAYDNCHPEPSRPQHPGATLETSGTTGDDSGTRVPRSPGTIPRAFRIPCQHCGADVLFPFDPVLSAKLDRLDNLEERLQDLLGAEVEVQR